MSARQAVLDAALARFAGAGMRVSVIGNHLVLHDVPAILVALSALFELKAGDLVFTGTPAGVAELRRGDRFHAELDGIAELHGRIA